MFLLVIEKFNHGIKSLIGPVFMLVCPVGRKSPNSVRQKEN